MKKEKEKFIKGCISKGYTKKTADDVFGLIEKFVGYGFNKSHSASYAMIAYQTAFMKSNYPVEFMTALLTAESRGSSGPIKNEKIAGCVAECRRLKIPVLPPDINKSLSEFTIENNTSIRFGLSAIKNVGAAAIDTILATRQQKPFTSLEDMSSRVDLSKVNKKTMESLIKAGALDSFGKRTALLMTMPEIVHRTQKQRRDKKEGQSSLFGDLENDVQEEKAESLNVDDFSLEEQLAFEKEFLGFYLTSHPQFKHLLNIKGAISHELEFLTDQKEGARVKIGGIVGTTKKIYTRKSGDEMAFVVLEDEKGLAVECVVFPKIFSQFKGLLIKDTIVIVDGKIDTKNEKPVVIVEKIYSSRIFSSE